MSQNSLQPAEIRRFYDDFDAPITALDCGQICAAHNESGKPFCCDICHAVPTVYESEWAFLQEHTDLWHVWKAEQCTDTPEEAAAEIARLKAETPDNMTLVECLGPDKCQRQYRALTCRQFPFFPYIDSAGNLLGLSYYWQFEDQCWVISNLQRVSDRFRQECIRAFEFIFARIPEEFETYQYHSEVMRDTFNEKRRAIPLLHRNGQAYKISTHNERMRRVAAGSLPVFGPYKLAREMPFPDEV